jgi:hypothetical protein
MGSTPTLLSIVPPRMRGTPLLLVFALVCAAPVALGQSAAAPRFEELALQFEYDRKAPADVREVGRRRRPGGVTVVDLTYASPRGGRVPAYMVLPRGRGPFAAVLFGHWMMSGSPLRDRRQFLEEAVVLARAGAVSLLIDAPYVRPGFTPEKEEMRQAAQSSEVSRQQVVDFRRGVDLLTARGDVDPRRIAYVGHSSPASVFLQFGRRDKPIMEKMARRYFALFGEPKRMGFYDAGHALDAAARRERVEWLARRLSLRRPDLAALARIPELK